MNRGNPCCKRHRAIKYIFYQHQFDALVCFTYNIGPYFWKKKKRCAYTNLAKTILKGDYSKTVITAAFKGYVNDTRRIQEANMFCDGNYNSKH